MSLGVNECVSKVLNMSITYKSNFALRFILAFALGTAVAQGPGGGRLPENIAIERDINYAGTNNPRQTLDILRPKMPREKLLPVVVAIHGGGWREGDKLDMARDIVPLVGSGDYACVSINYRLTVGAIWPAQIYDCKAAIRWVRANAAKYGLDANRIGVIGNSAGGHLAALLGTTGDVEKLEGDVGPYRGVSSRVQCVVDKFGPVDLVALGDYAAQKTPDPANTSVDQLIGGPVQQNKERAGEASPITYVSKTAPPFLIIHGGRDPLVPIEQSARLNKALNDAGARSLFFRVMGGGHGGFANPEIPRRIRQFFDNNLRGGHEIISEAPVPNTAR